MTETDSYCGEPERARNILSSLRQVPFDCAGYMLARLSRGLRDTEAGRLCVISSLFERESTQPSEVSPLDNPL